MLPQVQISGMKPLSLVCELPCLGECHRLVDGNGKKRLFCAKGKMRLYHHEEGIIAILWPSSDGHLTPSRTTMAVAIIIHLT